MDKKTLSLARKHLRQINSLFPAALVAIPKETWPTSDPAPVAVLRSRDYLVQIFDEAQGFKRLSICRTSLDGHGRWADNISWDELQGLKSEAGFSDFDAMEIFPADHDVVNVANIRHLWISPAPLTLAWRNK